MLQARTLVDEKYEILELISRGAFGVIYKARQLGFERTVALKLMVVPEPQLQVEFFKRFEREARILCGLQHVNLVGFHGFGIFEQSPYIAMVHIEGEDLERVLARAGKLSFHESAMVLKQVAAGLVCVHSHGIVHRDLKPANIMLCAPQSSPLVKVIDFGLAKSSGDVQKLTQTGLTVGTSEYMSPEQCMGEAADWRSDIYSLGCILQHCLTGQPPFEGETEVAIMRQHIDCAPPRLAKLADVPPASQYIVDKAMAKKPERRYQSMSEFLGDLEALDSGSVSLIASGAPAAGPDGKLRLMASLQNALLILCILASGGFGVGLSYFLLGAHKPQSAPVYLSSSSDYLLALNKLYDCGATDERTTAKCIELGEAALEKNKYDHLLSSRGLAQDYLYLSRLYVRSHRFRQSMEVSNKAIDLLMRDGTAGFKMEVAAQSYLDASKQLGESEQACKLLQNIVRRTGQCKYELAVAYVNNGQYDQALRVVPEVQMQANGAFLSRSLAKQIALAKAQAAKAVRPVPAAQ